MDGISWKAVIVSSIFNFLLMLTIITLGVMVVAGFESPEWAFWLSSASCTSRSAAPNWPACAWKRPRAASERASIVLWPSMRYRETALSSQRMACGKSYLAPYSRAIA